MFTNIKSPFEVKIKESYLYNLEKSYWSNLESNPEPTVGGIILGLETYSYEGLSFTFLGYNGGIFHNLPFTAIENIIIYEGDNPKDHPLLRIEPNIFYLDNLGFITQSKLTPDIHYYSKTKERLGKAYYLTTISWDIQNVLYHLLYDKESKQFLLWPSHKILVSNFKGITLPDWKKKRY